MNAAIIPQVVWLIIGILTAVFAVVRLYAGDKGACPVLALVAGVLLALGGAGIWP